MIFLYILSWHTVGAMILGIVGQSTPLGNLHGFPCFNPIWMYKNCRLNWFGAFLCAIGLNLCCPIITICYWTYKLCTVGRK